MYTHTKIERPKKSNFDEHKWSLIHTCAWGVVGACSDAKIMNSWELFWEFVILSLQS
jgi:hypothetical protein